MAKQTFFRVCEIFLLPISHLLASIIISLSLLPSILFIKFVFAHFGLLPINLYVTLLQTTVIIISYFIFGYVLLLILSLIRTVFNINSKEEDIPKNSLKLFLFAAHHSLIWLASFLFLPFIKNTFLINSFFRGMGAKIGKNTFINTSKISDCNLIEIGDNCMIGGDAVINGHSAEGDSLIRAKVLIGNNVSIGQYTTIMPGAIIEDNVIIGANSLVMKNQVLKANNIYLGVPARLLIKGKITDEIQEPKNSGPLNEDIKLSELTAKLVNDPVYSQALLNLYNNLSQEIIQHETSIFNLTIASFGVCFSFILYSLINDIPLLFAVLPIIISIMYGMSIMGLTGIFRVAYKKCELELYFQKAGIGFFNWETKYGAFGTTRVIDVDGIFIATLQFLICGAGFYLTFNERLFINHSQFLNYSMQHIFIVLDLISFAFLFISFAKFFRRKTMYKNNLKCLRKALRLNIID